MVDAFEQGWNQDESWGPSFETDPLFYFNRTKGNIITETKKAYLIENSFGEFCQSQVGSISTSSFHSHAFTWFEVFGAR